MLPAPKKPGQRQPPSWLGSSWKHSVFWFSFSRYTLPFLLERAIDSGFGDLDYSSLFEVVNPPDSTSPHS